MSGSDYQQRQLEGSQIRAAFDRLEADIDSIRLIDDELKAFNIFEVLQVQRRELQHSNFLAYLLDPDASHGLRASFLKAFLSAAIARGNPQQFSLSAEQIEQWDLARSHVIREWESKDILIRNPLLHFIAVVENKIDDEAGEGQLDRYRRRIEQQYPDYVKLFVYLTPEGERPREQEWVNLDYSSVADLLKSVLRQNSIRIDDGHRIVLEQYIQVLRRHVVKDTELAKRARELYQKHQRAFDFIFENKPSYVESLHRYLHSVIARDKRLRPDSMSAQYFRFVSKEWDRIEGIHTPLGWNDGALVTIELQTPAVADRALDLHIAIHVSRSPRLARAIYEVLEDKKLRATEYAWARKKKIAIPTELNEDFSKDVGSHLMSYVSEELPDITRKISKAARILSKD